jgi:hypothetical protein
MEASAMRRSASGPWRLISAVIGAAAVAYSGCGRAHRPEAQGPVETVGSASPSKPAGRKMKFPLRVSEDHRHVVDRTGAAVFVQGEAAWSLIARLEREDAEAYLEDRRRRGFNLLMVNLLEHHYADNPPANAYGVKPFERDGDFATPNPAYFAHADWVLQRALDKELLILLCPAYLGFEGGEQGWFQEMVQNGPDKLRAYGRFVGARYAGYPNVIWLEGGDYEPPPEHLRLVNAVAEGIKEGGANQLHAAHWSPEVSGAEVPVSGWLDLDTTYTYEPVYLKSLADYRRADNRPHFLLESAYEAERESTPWSLRGQAYHAVLTGAIGHVFGSRDIWAFEPNWTASLASAGSVSMTHVRTLFESVGWPSLEPDQRNRLLVRGIGTSGDREYAVLSSASDGTLAVAYVPTLREIGVDLSTLQKPLRARWYDPSNGTFRDAALAAGGTGRVAFTPPGKNASGDEDWVLVLEHAPRRESREHKG